MSTIKEQMTSLRAFVESLSYADSISTKQISILSQKLEAFFETIEELDFEEADNQDSDKSISIEIDDSFDDMDDDLPF